MSRKEAQRSHKIGSSIAYGTHSLIEFGKQARHNEVVNADILNSMIVPFETPTHDLAEQVGDAHWRQRLALEAKQELKVSSRTDLKLPDQDHAEPMIFVLHHLLKAFRLYDIGHRNFLDLQTVHNHITLERLPAAFDGYKILHLSDLHIDLDPALTPIIIEKIAPLEYDLCVITGDYRLEEVGPYDEVMALMAQIAAEIQQPTYAILGNHDYIEFVPPLEAMGLQFLLNETVRLERDGASLYLSGVDDPYYYMADNIQKSAETIPANAPAILLSHSPENYRRAAAAGYDLMLCGHTHGGQICLPGRIPLLTNADCPRQMIYGNWQHDALKGYTSAGTGSSGLPVRFFCPPEITLHTLHSN